MVMPCRIWRVNTPLWVQISLCQTPRLLMKRSVKSKIPYFRLKMEGKKHVFQPSVVIVMLSRLPVSAQCEFWFRGIVVYLYIILYVARRCLYISYYLLSFSGVFRTGVCSPVATSFAEIERRAVEVVAANGRGLALSISSKKRFMNFIFSWLASKWGHFHDYISIISFE